LDRSPESYLRDIVEGLNIKSILDVGTGHSGPFDMWNWEKKNLNFKGCVDICLFRYDIPKSWFKVLADGCLLPFLDNSFDVVVSTETIEHVPKEKWETFVKELERVSRDLIFISTSDFTKHDSEEDRKLEQVNPFSRFQAFPSEVFFKQHGFHVLFISPHQIKAFKRKIPEWDSTFKDMDTYVIALSKDLDVESVMDVGTGRKGVVAQHFWENEKHIKQGYAVDIWKIKALPSIWKPMRIDALTLENYFQPDSIDVVQAFGFLEHLKKEDGFKFLKIAEKIARKLVIISAATYVHGATRDYKVKIDGNPHHYYHSTWHWKEFEALGYETNYEDMKKGITFSGEAIAWKHLQS